MTEGKAPKDTLFAGPGMDQFVFDNRVAAVFDDMAQRSIPAYRQVIDMVARLFGHFLPPGARVYDLGCSTGNTLLALDQALPHLALRLTGIDTSHSMLAKARQKSPANIVYIKADITQIDLTGCQAVVLNYMLQFLPPARRLPLLRRIHQALDYRGILVLSEKTIIPEPDVNQAFTRFYYAFKREQGYSEIEISRKRDALENVLVPFSQAENETLLRQAGFRTVVPFFQWFNFVSLLAVK